MKKILTIIFITITVLSLTGCTNNDGGESVQKVSFEELEDLHELLKDMPIRDTMEFAFYKELDATQIGETNLFEYTKKDKPKKEVSFTKADDLFKFLGKLREDYTPYRIKLESDMNIDCTKFNFTNEAGYAGTLNAGVLVIPEGKTITISGRSANDMAIIFPMIVLEKNSKIILENNANLVSDIFLAKQGSKIGRA